MTRLEDASYAGDVGASYIGVVLASGPRLLDVERARSVLGPPRHSVRRVAVFGHQTVEEITRCAGALDLDVMQLHAVTSVEFVSQLIRAAPLVWPVVRVSGTTLPDHAVALAALTGWLVLDAYVPGQLGGTGHALDWSGLVPALDALRFAQPTVRIVLAGGLTAENVGRAIAALAPDVVDVSSGIEQSPGVKDRRAMQQFARAVDAASGNGR